MLKYSIHIRADTDEQLKNELREITNIVMGMREAQKLWKDVYGCAARLQKERWEKKADEWIEKHKVDDVRYKNI